MTPPDDDSDPNATAEPEAAKKSASPRDPTEDAKEHLKQGLGLLWRAAQDVASTVKKEIDREGVSKAIDDAGREIARAANNVMGRLGAEISKGQGYSRRSAPDDEKPQWPTTREEYEARHGAIEGDWPKTADEYEARFGTPPESEKPKGPTPSDPGFRIAVDDDEAR